MTDSVSMNLGNPANVLQTTIHEIFEIEAITHTGFAFEQLNPRIRRGLPPRILQRVREYVEAEGWLMAMSWRPASAATNCCKDVHAAPLRTRSLHFAILGLARRRDCTDGIRLYGRYQHHEAQRSDGERGETQNVFHISSYPFSILRRTGASAAGSVANSGAAGFS